MSAGTFVKIALTELLSRGCRVEVVAHDPPAIHFSRPDGTRCAVLVEDEAVVLAYPGQPERFHSLRSALLAACESRPRTA
jgi:hypothetical protein